MRAQTGHSFLSAKFVHAHALFCIALEAEMKASLSCRFFPPPPFAVSPSFRFCFPSCSSRSHDQVKISAILPRTSSFPSLSELLHCVRVYLEERSYGTFDCFDAGSKGKRKKLGRSMRRKRCGKHVRACMYITTSLFVLKFATCSLFSSPRHPPTRPRAILVEIV